MSTLKIVRESSPGRLSSSVTRISWKMHFYFPKKSHSCTAYLAFWSSICCPEYIFLLGSWSTLPERVPSSLFAFRTFSMKEWLWCNHHIIIDYWKKVKLSESSPPLQKGQPPSRSPEREQSSVVCPTSWTTLSRALRIENTHCFDQTKRE